MKSIFKLIAFPISFVIGLISFLIILCFGNIWSKADTFELNLVRINREAQYLYLTEKWFSMHPFFRAIISCIIYWFIWK